MLEIFGISFMKQSLLAGLLVSIMCAYLAVYVVLKRIVFVGIALGQMSSAGVAMALLCGLNPMLFSIIFMLGGVSLFSIRWSERRIPREAIIGITYAAAAALGILLIAKSASGESHMLNLLFGNILAVTPKDIYMLSGVFAASMLVHFLFAKEFLISSFDHETAQTVGVRAKLWDFILYLTLGAVIAVGIRVVGVLLLFALLVIPGAIALALCNRMRSSLIMAVAVGVAPLALGLYLSFIWDLPSAATIVALLFILFCISLPVSRLRKC